MSKALKEVDGLKERVFENAYKVLEEKGLVIIWMSVGNGYFDKEKIGEIIRYAKESFSLVKILIPYEPAVYTYLALGYDQVKSYSKARLGSNRLRNHSKRAIEGSQKVELVAWGNVEKSPFFKNQLEFINGLYQSSELFCKDADDTTRQILENKSKEKVSKENIKIGVKYLLEELAFVLCSPDFFGVERTAYMYHRHWPIYENLVNGMYDHQTRGRLGFLLVNEGGRNPQ